MSSIEEELQAFAAFKQEVLQIMEGASVKFSKVLLQNARSARTYTRLRRDIFAVMNTMGGRTAENGVTDFVAALNDLQARAGKLGDLLQARSLGADPIDV